MTARFRVLVTDRAWPDTSIEQQVVSEINAEIVEPESPGEDDLVRAAATVDAIATNWAKVSEAVIRASRQCRIIARFGDYPGNFPYHCHLLEHEDHEMMRQMQVMPACGTADFDADGDSGTDADIEAFFACLAGNCCAMCFGQDFDQDGDSGTDFDIEAFFRVLAGLPC